MGRFGGGVQRGRDEARRAGKSPLSEDCWERSDVLEKLEVG
jgi:hypothetical protein